MRAEISASSTDRFLRALVSCKLVVQSESILAVHRPSTDLAEETEHAQRTVVSAKIATRKLPVAANASQT